MTPVIQPPAPSDLDDLVRLLQGQYGEHAIELPVDALRAAVRAVLDDPGRGAFLVARAGGRAIGLAYLAFTWTLEHGGRTAWLEELFVDPEARTAGVGTALLRAALALARERGCVAMDLEVEADHARAEHLYAREGFLRRTRARWWRRLD